MDFEIDRTDRQPSLADMTKKSIEILQKNKKGYFLYVEGGRIDHGHHANMAKRALTDTLAFDQAVEVAKSMTSQSDTLIVITADHSHVMVIAGYASRGNPILGVMNSQSLAPATDGLDFTTILYGNGPGYSFVNGTRANVTAKDTTIKSFRQHAGVPLVSETHAGEDVTMYARGPMSHLFTGVREQNYIATAMAYASCVGDDKRHCQRFVKPPTLSDPTKSTERSSNSQKYTTTESILIKNIQADDPKTVFHLESFPDNLATSIFVSAGRLSMCVAFGFIAQFVW